MSEHIAYPLARELAAYLTPYCVRLEIAGSIRREKPSPEDIEIVCVPKVVEYSTPDMFDLVADTHAINRLDGALMDLYQDGTWTLARDAETQRPLRNGPNWKKLQHASSGYRCDLFITTTRCWGYTFTVRTGPAEFSHALVTRALNHGHFFRDGLLHAHAPLFEMKQGKRETQPCPLGDACPNIIETPDEIDIFNVLGLTYIEPQRRHLANPTKIMQRHHS